MALPASGPISFSQLKAEVNSYETIISTTSISLSDLNIRNLLSGPTATSGAPYAAGTQISTNQAYSKSWRITFSTTNSGTVSNINLFSAAVSAGWNKNADSGSSPNIYFARPVAFTYTNNGTITSTSTGSYSIQTGSAASYVAVGSTLRLVNNSLIVGRGGDGGDTSTNSDYATNGTAGGPALLASRAITIDNNSRISGGGGGGGGGAWGRSSGSLGTFVAGGTGGGGIGNGVRGTSSIGSNGGSAGNLGTNGTTTAVGSGGAQKFVDFSATGQSAFSGAGGAGGTYGSAGANGLPGDSLSGNTPSVWSLNADSQTAFGTGGAAGSYAVGTNNITWESTGTRNGPSSP